MSENFIVSSVNLKNQINLTNRQSWDKKCEDEINNKFLRYLSGLNDSAFLTGRFEAEISLEKNFTFKKAINNHQ